MQGQIKSSTALRRQDKLEMFWEELRQQRWENYVGQVLDVLIEGRGSDSPDEFVGRAWFQAPEIDGQVIVNSSSCKPGQIVKTEIDDVVGTTLFAHTL
jgi:ribosomal protein S12 methylthiotransferase